MFSGYLQLLSCLLPFSLVLAVCAHWLKNQALVQDVTRAFYTDTWTHDTTHCVSYKAAGGMMSPQRKPLLSWYLFPCFLAAELSFCVSRGTCYFQDFDVWRVFEIITAIHFVHNYSEEQAFYCDPNCSSSAKTRPCASFQETRTCSCTWEHYVNS